MVQLYKETTNVFAGHEAFGGDGWETNKRTYINQVAGKIDVLKADDDAIYKSVSLFIQILSIFQSAKHCCFVSLLILTCLYSNCTVSNTLMIPNVS